MRGSLGAEVPAGLRGSVLYVPLTKANSWLLSYRAQRVCVISILLWLSGAHFAKGCTDDDRSTGGFVRRQNGSLDEDL